MKSIRHSFGQNVFHYAWRPKYAQDPFKCNLVRIDCELFLREVARRHGYEIYKLHVAIDHAHLFVGMPTLIFASKAIQLLRTRSAFELFWKHPRFRKHFRKRHFWSPRKTRSVGNTTIKAVDHYIVSSYLWICRF